MSQVLNECDFYNFFVPLSTQGAIHSKIKQISDLVLRKLCVIILHQLIEPIIIANTVPIIKACLTLGPRRK